MAFAPNIALGYLRRAHDSNRLGHAYLLVGEEPALELAWQVASLVVPAPLARVAGHQDVHLVEPESRSRRIVVTQMRELENALRLRASSPGGRKVGVVREADRLQPQAANAFLKTLEEPPASSLLLLVTSQPEALMETILSRCIKVAVRTPGETKKTARSPEEAALLELLAGCRSDPTGAQAGTSSVPKAYGMLRDFTRLLASARSRLQGNAEKALEAEEEHYSKTTDGAWLNEREGYYKSLIEAQYAAERSRLVEVIGRWWGDVLRQRTTESSAGNGGCDSTVQVLQRLAALDELRENLDRNIQEALALEVAFLQVFGA